MRCKYGFLVHFRLHKYSGFFLRNEQNSYFKNTAAEKLPNKTIISINSKYAVWRKWLLTSWRNECTTLVLILVLQQHCYFFLDLLSFFSRTFVKCSNPTIPVFSLFCAFLQHSSVTIFFIFRIECEQEKLMSLSFSHSFINDGLTCFLFFAKNCYYRLVSTYLLEKSLKLLTVAKKHFFKKQKNPADLAYLVIKSQNCHQQAKVLIKTAEGHQLEKKYVLKTSLRRLLHRTNLFQNFISSI